MTKEKLIETIMAEAEKDGEPVTKEEAEEMAEMEIKAGNIKNYTESKDKKPRKPKERKIDEEKKYLLGCVKTLFEEMGADILNVKTETEIEFNYQNTHYSIKLTKHRPPKA